jgi:DNA (cytosine-5)-methyltransferase 1
MTLTVGSCFAGIGGFDLGLEQAGGFETRWWSEVKPAACRVMAARFPSSEPVGDIVALTEGLFGAPAVDVIVGGPPCQGISAGNAYGRRGLADERSALFYAYAALIDAQQPTWLVMEQVSGLLTSGDDYAAVINTLRKVGYELEVVIVNTLAYVPQTRERIIIVGHRDAHAAAGALLPLIEDGGRNPGENKPPRRRAPSTAESSAYVYRKSRRPANDRDAETWVVADYANTLTLFDVGTARATVIVLDELEQPRVLTPEEWEACHGFPRGWTVPAGSDVDRWSALGNAVSPLIIKRVGDGIRAAS